ncbi:MAG: NRDE family protein [Xanthomonadales bacterium]|nr:NRDE family protein [Xanthomonadales bacterium]
MCLILFAWRTHPRYPLVLAANRDEFHARPTAAAAFWDDAPQLLGGRDLEAGGTWLGVTRKGKFAAITNYREPPESAPPQDHSRGQLVTDYLLGNASPLDYARQIQANASAYRAYNLLLGDAENLIYTSNRRESATPVAAGIHGLSNHLLDTPWPKVCAGKERLAGLLREDRVDPEALLRLLGDPQPVPGSEPPVFDRALAPEWTTRLSFIRSPVYGTRSSTVLLIGRDGEVVFVERQFDPQGRAVGTCDQRFEIPVANVGYPRQSEHS